MLTVGAVQPRALQELQVSGGFISGGLASGNLVHEAQARIQGGGNWGS